MIPLPPPAAAPQLPCPLSAGWDVVARTTLPRRDAAGDPAGGYSAAAYLPQGDVLWLLSDAPRGHLRGWKGLRGFPASPLQPLGVVPLSGSAAAALPEAIDGEGLVLLGEEIWVASEGRRSAARPGPAAAI